MTEEASWAAVLMSCTYDWAVSLGRSGRRSRSSANPTMGDSELSYRARGRVGCPVRRFLSRRPGPILSIRGSRWHASVRPVPRPVLGRAPGPGQVARGVDETDVRERLREIAEQPARARVVLLGQPADVVADSQDALENLARLGQSALQGEVVGQPQGAGKERPFPRRQAIHLGPRPVAGDEPIHGELVADRLRGRAHPSVRSRQESDERDHQQAGVDLAATVVLHEHALATVDTVTADVGVDGLAYLPPALDGAVKPEPLDGLDRAVESHPGHHFGVCEVAAAATHLPDALVGLAPRGRDELGECPLHAPGVAVGLEPRAPGDVERVEDLAVRVE